MMGAAARSPAAHGMHSSASRHGVASANPAAPRSRPRRRANSADAESVASSVATVADLTAPQPIRLPFAHHSRLTSAAAAELLQVKLREPEPQP